MTPYLEYLPEREGGWLPSKKGKFICLENRVVSAKKRVQTLRSPYSLRYNSLCKFQFSWIFYILEMQDSWTTSNCLPYVHYCWDHDSLGATFTVWKTKLGSQAASLSMHPYPCVRLYHVLPACLTVIYTIHLHLTRCGSSVFKIWITAWSNPAEVHVVSQITVHTCRDVHHIFQQCKTYMYDHFILKWKIIPSTLVGVGHW